MKKLLLIIAVIFLSLYTKAQQFGLFNTGTLFDSFENPSQKAFVADSSRQYMSNFFIPNLGANVLNTGNNDYAFRKLVQEGIYSTKYIDANSTGSNHLSAVVNFYIFAFRFFKSAENHQELGFSWQIKSDVNSKYNNQVISVYDSYKNFDPEKTYSNLSNNYAVAQSYHQFSVTYRQDWDKKWAFGGKFSILGGIQYNAINIDKYSFFLDAANNRANITAIGNYRGANIDSNSINPFKNPGAAISFGGSYTSKSGYTLTGNVKDLGFIRWAKDSQLFDIDLDDQINNISSTDGQARLRESLKSVLKNDVRKAFISPINTRVDFMLSKTFDFYQPTFILSKNVFNINGDIALVNNFSYKSLSAAFIPRYSLNKAVLIGLQAMYKTPNFEVFLGSDNAFKSLSTLKGFMNKDADIGSGYNGTSFYFGIALKFGRIIEHSANSSWMPGTKSIKTSPSEEKRY